MKNLKNIVFGLAFATTLLVTSGCTRTEQAITVLEGEEYTDIEITGYAWFMCGNGDSFSTGFIAKNRKGQTVSGAVCSGLFKGATIRY